MWEVLKCSVNKDFYVTAAFDDELKHGKLKMICVKLHYSGDENKVLATKAFAWPESKFPTEVSYNDKKNMLIFKGTSNIAEVPINLSASTLALLNQTSSPRATIYGLSSLDSIEPHPELASIILNITDGKDVEENWNALVKLCGKVEIATIPTGLLLSATQQQEFFHFVCERIKQEKSFEILCFLLRQNIFTSVDMDTKIIQFCTEEQCFDPVFCLLQSSKIISERAYAQCLKIVVERLKLDGRKLLKDLMNKSFTRLKLSFYISEYLSDDDVLSLLDEFTVILKGDHTSLQFNKTVNLLNALIDSHAQRLIWNEKSKESLSNATELLTDMMQSLDVFNNFDVRLKQRLKLGNKLFDEPRRSDYSIQKVPFKLKFL